MSGLEFDFVFVPAQFILHPKVISMRRSIETLLKRRKKNKTTSLALIGGVRLVC